MKRFFLLLILAFLLQSCARVGSPVGGKKDTLAPIMTGSNIDTPRINVPRDIRELRIDFNEYVSLNNITKNLIISPPITKIKRILPSNLANRYVLIQWEDTLQANTTYNFNFGNAIKDNNEGNLLPYFNFAFSTGDKIDDLYLSGEVSNKLKPSVAASSGGSGSSSNEKNLVVGLYKDSDSINYKQKPYYITVADADGYYELNYLSPGAYRLLAFEDLNGNSVFDTGTENVGFLKDTLMINQSRSGLNLNLYPSKVPVKYLEAKENPGGIMLSYQGRPDSLKVTSLSAELKDFKVTHRQKSDSAFIWFNAKGENIGVEKSQQLRFAVNSGVKTDSISIFYRMNPKNEMTLANGKGSILPPKSNFEITSNYALNKINTEGWTLVSDSIAQPLSALISEHDPFRILVSSEFKEGKKYSLTVPKQTVFSYYDQNAQGYRFDFETDKLENYGSVTLKLAGAPDAKFWLQLLNAKNEAVYSQYTQGSEVKFSTVKPDTYLVRMLVDNNGNGFWDPADFENGIFAEDFYDFDKKISARPLWDIVEMWNLKPAAPAANPLPTTASEPLPLPETPLPPKKP